MTIHDAIEAVNAVALIVFIILSSALVAVLGRRIYMYRRAKWPIPLLLRRNLVFFGGLGGLVFESALLRVIGGALFTSDTILRLGFIVQYDVVALLLFSYYLKVEAMDVNDPRRP